jgi:hypothetical protein
LRSIFEGAERPFLAVLIHEIRIRHLVAGFEQFESGRRRRRPGCRRLERRRPDLLHVSDESAIGLHDERGVDQIAGRDTIQLLRIFYVVAHGHRRHEVLDFFMFDRGLLMIGRDGQNLALQGIGP